MSKGRPRYARKPKPRVKRQLKRRLLIVVEGDSGKSEQVYFQRLAQFLRSSHVTPSIKVVPGKGEPSKVLDTCINIAESQEFDEKFLVLDVDEHPTLEDTLQQAKKDGISVVVTNRQFEQWLYWHLFEDSGGAEKTMIKKLIEEKCLKGKNGKELGTGFPVENYPKAVECAQRSWSAMEANAKGPYPSSAIPCLIRAMKG